MGRGGRPVRIPDTPPSDPQKFSNLSFSKLRFGAKWAAPRAPNFFFFAGMRHALEFFNTLMCVHSKCSVRIGDFGSTPGGGRLGPVQRLLFHQAIGAFERQISKTRRCTNVVCCEVLSSGRLAKRAAMQIPLVAWRLALGIRTPTLWFGPWSWGYALRPFGVAPRVWDTDSLTLVWPLELGIRTPGLWCGLWSWGYRHPRFGVAP